MTRARNPVGRAAANLLVVALAFAFAVSITGCRGRSARGAGGTLPFYDSPDFTPRWDVARDDTSFHRVRPFSLVNQRGEPFTEENLRGKISVVDFFFASCTTLCIKMATSMRGVQRALRDDDDVLLVSHSVTPDVDTVDVLARYATNRGVDFARWKLLTGSRAEIYDLGRHFYFVEEDLGVNKSPKDFLHTENFVLLDKQRRLRGIYNGLDPNSMKVLVDDVHALQREE